MTETQSMAPNIEIEKTPSKPRMRPTYAVFWLVAFILAGLGIGAFLTSANKPGTEGTPHNRHTSITTPQPLKIKAVRPVKIGDLAISVEQLGVVEAFYRSDLRARASGIVKSITADIGDRVRKGDVLVTLDVPELNEEVARSEKLIDQRRQEKRVAEARLEDAIAARNVAKAAFKQKSSDATGVEATRNLRKAKVNRYRELAERGTVVGSVVEEEERDYLAAESALSSALAAVERAQADLGEIEAKIKVATEEVELREVMIDVAQKECQRAIALSENAKIFAPFDGVIIQRNIDPGSFVQNASTGSSESLISMALTDVVTLSARFPDSVAPYIESGARCDVLIDDINLQVPAVVTRFAPLVQATDRSIRVEVDLFNGNKESLNQYYEEQAKLGENRQTKGLGNKLPTPAFESTEQKKTILPGMTCKMSLRVAGFGDSYVLPASAVYARSGKSYLMQIVQGETLEHAVKVQLNDGKLAKVSILDAKPGSPSELDGSELIVLGKQLEIGAGRTVDYSISEW